MTRLPASTNNPAVIETVTALVATNLTTAGRSPSIGATDSLSDAGISSLGMVNLMFAIEAAFDVFIPPEHVSPTSFRSIESIARMVEMIQSKTATNAA